MSELHLHIERLVVEGLAFERGDTTRLESAMIDALRRELAPTSTSERSLPRARRTVVRRTEAATVDSAGPMESLAARAARSLGGVVRAHAFGDAGAARE